MLSKVRSLLAFSGRKTSSSAEAVNPFFSFTSGHWLSNHDAHVKARYAPFNIEGLQRVASRAIGSKIQSMEKIAESLNSIFLLTFQDGQQAIARIPTPLSGPAHFTTASEVATMDLVRRLGVPVPKVLAWSSRAGDTEVEAEFMIMEKAGGVPLAKVWDEVDRVDLVGNLVKMLEPLVRLRFKHYGSVYYRGDVDASLNPVVEEFVQDAPSGVDLGDFCIGPISRREFWEDERAAIAKEERGPWTSARDYMVDVALREQQWIDQYAKPHLHDDFLCCLPHQGKLDDHIELLEYYKHVLSLLVPSDPQHLSGHLWHPDLHASNLLVTPSGTTSSDGKIQVDITSCIDWQGAWVGPAFLQLTAPALLRDLGAGPEALILPPNFETLNLETKARAQAMRFHEEAVLQHQFETLAFGHLSGLPVMAELRLLEELSHITWKTGLLPFRDVLIKIWKQWDTLVPHKKCPITFSPAELEEHDKMFAYYREKREFANALDEEFSLEEFGYVEGADKTKFMKIKEVLERRKEKLLDSAKSKEERAIKGLMWPYRDTLSDNPRSHLKLDINSLQ
ncbi:kinase-like domain-containing protein [Panaeolus papilionaceus]|nr:kinase-like domain-containing protein [Panaeolus papilionaceus]